MTFGVLILGAGASRRMGQPKLILPWKGQTVIEHLITQWRELDAAQITIVMSDDNSALCEVLKRSEDSPMDHIINPHPEQGMFSSIQCAARWSGWNPDLTHMVITLGDQPHLQPTTLANLLRASKEYPNHICQPADNGRPKHPVLLPWEDFNELRHTPQPTLAHFLRECGSSRQHLVESTDPGLSLDLDTPTDYRRALQL